MIGTKVMGAGWMPGSPGPREIHVIRIQPNNKLLWHFVSDISINLIRDIICRPAHSAMGASPSRSLSSADRKNALYLLDKHEYILNIKKLLPHF